MCGFGDWIVEALGRERGIERPFGAEGVGVEAMVERKVFPGVIS